ncbi:MAG: hypothetical protein RLZZ443_398 [Actinomycetota bacterium]|jgi:hypothetical protein
MPSIQMTQDALIVRLTSAEKFWAFGGDVVIPWSQLRGAETVEPKFWLKLGMRAPGTGLAPWYVAGTYRRRGDRAFVSWSSKRPALQINLDGHKFNRVVIGIEDAEGWAERINYTLASC